MENIYTTTQLDADLRALREKAASIPNINRLRVVNYFGKLLVETQKVARLKDEPQDNQALHDQIAARYDANKAIFEALKAGRHISLENSQEFRVSEMHTQIHCIRARIEKENLPYILRDRWINIGALKRRVKEYWLEPKEETTINS